MNTSPNLTELEKGDYVLILTRVSTSDQTTNEAQAEECKRFAESKEAKVIDVLSETVSVSPKENEYDPLAYFKRIPSLQYCLDHLDDLDRKWNCLLCWRFDRLSRSTDFQENFCRRMNDKGIKVLSATEGGHKMIRRVMGIVAQEETDTKLIRVQLKRIERAENGISCQRAPYGYMIVKDLSNKKNILPFAIVPEKADKLKLMFAEILKHKRPSIVAKEYNFPKRSLDFILRNKAYAGYVKVKDEWFLGKHEKIITLKQFNKIQELLEKYKRKKKKW